MTWICCEHGEHDGSECTHCVAAEREQYAEEVARLTRERDEARDMLERVRIELGQQQANEGRTVAQLLEARALLSREQATIREQTAELAELNKTHVEVCVKLDEARAAIARVGVLLGDNGCDCECGHHHEEHDEDCERCFACQVQDAIVTGGG